MLLESSIWNSTAVYLTWRGFNTKSRHLLFQLVPSTPRTEGTGCGLLRTPEAGDAPDRTYAVNSRGEPKLSGQIKDIAMLPTPTETDFRTGYGETEAGRKRREHPRGDPLRDVIPGKNRGLKLQPAFVEWMMGYPIGYTDLKR
jgi:hypothetical protein